jgi:hypothetical protein
MDSYRNGYDRLPVDFPANVTRFKPSCWVKTPKLTVNHVGRIRDILIENKKTLCPLGVEFSDTSCIGATVRIGTAINELAPRPIFFGLFAAASLSVLFVRGLTPTAA